MIINLRFWTNHIKSDSFSLRSRESRDTYGGPITGMAITDVLL
ncbi:uncharacterized protein Nmag_0805 [Natrialba magadii ATCC 43099]|uniref:Uncharacterized protein n=1 Tax=Natrialba magadii (strain ATCC 43099 / DSM 3394 / CCM 3739 / CIP 104546 / IAM 13178 / JCM 8861 / NBRC 102185 / NCIMB 2190 / MS3) TaxID=547559 RepID=D3T031_NATMM|nr:uncharacterized protein Nmag_0805 [Natrialba magadii ATCC 43099]